MMRRKRYYSVLKRVLDIFGAAFLIILTSPLMLITALLVRIKLGTPVIFSQPRPGLNEKIFKLLKFRSMKNVDISNGLISDEQRMTKFGMLLRSTSLDELPSLWNVLRGEMSFVGPRPLLVEYLNYYSDQQRKRHLVKPGITGLAQSSGRNVLSWEQKFDLDLRYSNEISFSLDFSILVRTIVIVLRRENINGLNGQLVEKFKVEKY